MLCLACDYFTDTIETSDPFNHNKYMYTLAIPCYVVDGSSRCRVHQFIGICTFLINSHVSTSLHVTHEGPVRGNIYIELRKLLVWPRETSNLRSSIISRKRIT